MAASLAIPENQVRIVHTPVGGAFGGKEDIAGQIHAALAAPLLIRGRLLGVIGVGTARPEQKFSETDLRLLNLFAYTGGSTLAPGATKTLTVTMTAERA